MKLIEKIEAEARAYYADNLSQNKKSSARLHGLTSTIGYSSQLSFYEIGIYRYYISVEFLHASVFIISIMSLSFTETRGMNF